MKGRAFFRIAFISATICNVACEKESIPAGQDVTLDIVCSADVKETRTQIYDNGKNIYWSAFDSLYVIKVDEGAGVLVGKNDVPAKTAEFTGTMYLSNGGRLNTPFYGVYPCDFSTYYNKKNDVLSITVPSEQTAYAGTFDPLSFPSLAKFSTGESSMNFRNVCGGLRFKVESDGIKSVEFSGNNSEILSGMVEVGFDDGSVPVVKRAVNPSQKVTLTCNDGLVPGEWYYISLLPVVLDKGFTITLKTDTRTVQYVSERRTQVKRSVFGELSQLDKGLFPEECDWGKNEFIHKSLLLSIPNRNFSGVVVAFPNETINTAIVETKGNMEVAQMFANGSGTTSGVFDLLSMFNVNTVPFFLTDYRQSGNSGISSTSSSTHSLYGTVSGIALNSYYNGNELSIDVSLYFKENDNYKVVALVTEEDTSYSFTYQSGRYMDYNDSDYITRYVASSILGDNVTVTSAPEIKYRSYKVNVSNTYKSGKLRVLVYVLRPYGSRAAVTNGSFGSCYVDNAFSARVGVEQALPIQISIDSEINGFEDGGTI